MKTLEELQELAIKMNYTLEELMYEMLCDSVDDLEQKDKEIARLNKIIDDLEKYLIFQIRHTDKEYIFCEVYHKLKELTEEGKFQEIPLFKGTMEQLDNLTILKEEGK